MKNKMRIIVSYIKSPSKYGESLFCAFQKWMSEFINRKNCSSEAEYELIVQDVVENVESASADNVVTVQDCQEAILLACLGSDMVIFDGSIEEDNVSQYRFACEPMKQLDYVLIVSRTELPYNFEGSRKGGAPSWILIGEQPSAATLEDNAQNRNADILNWLKHTIPQLELPRRDKREDAKLSIQNVSLLTTLIKNSEKRLSDSQKLQPSLFISYLSKDYPRLKAAFPEIAAQTGIPIENFHYFAPGRVAKELMTERRRWEIVSITEREIRKTDCIVVFETEGYHQSWWTTGEQMSISYMNQEHWTSCPDVYVAKVDSGSIQWAKLSTPEQKQAYFPQITDKQKRKLARRFANSDPNEAAFELDQKISRQAAQPRLVKGCRAVVKGVLVAIMEKNGYIEEMLGEHADPREKKLNLNERISLAIESEFSYTHTRAFKETRIVECPYCRQERSTPLTIDDFIQLDMPYVYRIEDNELAEAGNNHLLLKSKCPRHPGVIRLQRNRYYSRFLQPRGKEKLKENITLMNRMDKIEFL